MEREKPRRRRVRSGSRQQRNPAGRRARRLQLVQKIETQRTQRRDEFAWADGCARANQTIDPPGGVGWLSFASFAFQYLTWSINRARAAADTMRGPRRCGDR